MRHLVLLALLTACSPAEPPAEPAAPGPQAQPAAPEAPAPAAKADAGEGARVQEEGRVAPRMQKAEAEEKARSSGILGAKEDAGDGIGGLIGTRGTALGSGGLGTRGVGLGGGGIATSYGMGRGASGYGKGGGSFGSAAPRVAERYTDYGINRVTLTADDRLSTFSIDVDTASYAIARSHLQRGQLPPTAAVRVEEMVNAQTYAYPPPDGEAPFAVSMEVAPDPWHDGHHILRVGVQAAQPEIDRLPVHLTFLVDTSGSMRASNKLPLARRALKELVANLDDEDRVAIATYAGSTGIALNPTRVGDGRQAIVAALDGLEHGGGTNMGSGMQLAYDMALATYEPGTENRVIVLSDGDANIGRTSHEQILKSLAGYAKKGITLSTIGFGNGNYNDTMMEQLANKGDGNYYYIDSFAEARKVFGEKLTATVQTVARDVKIQVDMDPGSVISYRLIGYENRDIADADFRNDAVDAGEIGSGHTVTALYDLVLRDDPAEDLATVRIRSKAPGPDAPSVERATRLPSLAVRTSFATATPDFRVAIGTAAFAEKLRGSPWADELPWSEIADTVRSAGRSGDAELVGLVETAGRLRAGDLAVR
ncbi:MAG: von Willebrand factor type A domain-containing protein [Alphaproteobacteria bacterium]|nr:von Willebrand factor type A domain-containing protein [Alphaproteobacteria bacterium]